MTDIHLPSSAISAAIKLVEKIYDDSLQPSAKQVGKTLEDVFKALRLTTLPFQALAFLQDKIDSFLKNTLNKVKEENRIMPPGQIILKIYQELNYYHPNTNTMELLSNLFACFLDKELCAFAHPAFLVIIPQLSEDEIKIVTILKDSEYEIEQDARYDRQNRLFDQRETKRNDFPLSKLSFPENFFLYINHLHSLGLAGCWQSGNQIPISENQQQVGTKIISKCKLTDFGRLFTNACIEKKHPYTK
jgi:hypothetical protein